MAELGVNSIYGASSNSLVCDTLKSLDPYVAIRVRARSEITIANILTARGVETICPVYLDRKSWADRIKVTPAALFPCYLFTRFDAALRNVIVTVPGVQDIVSNSRGPLPVDPQDIEVVQRLTIDYADARPFPLPAVGQRVRIEYGPLTGIEGTLVRVKNQARVVLSIHALDRAVITEVAEDQITVL